MMSYELATARSGALDTDLLAQRQFYGTDFTRPLLFLEDGAYFGNLATAQHLQAEQWGVMNETGNYPGQPWLWLYQLWYQIPPGSTRWSAAADVWAVARHRHLHHGTALSSRSSPACATSPGSSRSTA